MDKIISLMITAVMTVTSCSFKGENPLDGKRIAFIGDSISYGTNWQGGYGKLIGEQYNMNVTNFSKGGATLADNVHWSENSDGYRPYITDMLDSGYNAEKILQAILGDMGLEILHRVPSANNYNSIRSRVEQALISLGKKELSQIIDEDKKAELTCHFCNKVYNFDESELKKLLVEACSR